jgi:hypothetical protein
MLLTLRVLLKPNKSSLLKLLRRLKTLVNKKTGEDKYDAQAGAERKAGNAIVHYQAAGGYVHEPFPRAPYTTAYMQEEPAAAKPAEEATAAPAKESEKKPEGKESEAKSPAPTDKLGWANQTKKEGLSVSAEVVAKQ